MRSPSHQHRHHHRHRHHYHQGQDTFFQNRTVDFAERGPILFFRTGSIFQNGTSSSQIRGMFSEREPCVSERDRFFAEKGHVSEREPFVQNRGRFFQNGSHFTEPATVANTVQHNPNCNNHSTTDTFTQHNN